jgi:ribosomal protein L7/L12
MKKVLLIATVFALFFAQAAVAADYKVVAYKGNLAKKSANVYGSKKSWTVASYSCGGKKIYVQKSVKDAINKWRSKGYRVKTFRIVNGKYRYMCTFK